MENSKIKLILASGSPRRKELLGHLRIPFEIRVKETSEDSDATDPLLFSQEIAERKGQNVLQDLLHTQGGPYLVVSADTIVSLKGRIYGKPRDRSEARTFLTELSGQTHSVFTAVSMHLYFQQTAYKSSFVEETKVTFNKISNDLMERYLDTGDSLDKAGAYGIQGPSLTFVSKVEGDYANVVGFPLARFILEARHFLNPFFPHEDIWSNLF